MTDLSERSEVDARAPAAAGVGARTTLMSDQQGYYQAYEEHSKVLRTWLVAYGVAAPVLFLTNEKLAQRFTESGEAGLLTFALLAGVGVQVVLAAVNKTAMWGCYYASCNPQKAGALRFRLAIWLAEQFWIDFIVDVVTLSAFVWATWRGLLIATGAA